VDTGSREENASLKKRFISTTPETNSAYFPLRGKGGCGIEITRAIDNRPMSSRSQALFRSIMEVKHALRQRYLQFNQHSRRSFTLVSGP
jgi:hypothetical protein